MKKAIIGFVVGTYALAALVAVGMVAMAVVGTASANHDTTPECGYTTTVNGDNYDVVIGLTAEEQFYYFEMDDPDVRVTAFANSDGRYYIQFSDADAGERQTFYAQAYTPGGDDYSFCQVHGGFYVKGG